MISKTVAHTITIVTSFVVLVSPAAVRADVTLFENDRVLLESLGYLRAGLGYERDGDDQICFQNPGARAKYRLGNECEVFSELSVTVGINRAEGRPRFQVSARGSFFLGSTNEFRNDDLSLQELYGRYFLAPDGPLGGAEIWGGTRFYKRFDIHINDFYYWTATGTGGGIDKIPLPIGTASVAVFATATDDVEDTGEDDDYTRFDARWEGIPLYDGATLDVGGDLRFRRDGARGGPGVGVQLAARHVDESAFGLGVSLATTLQIGTGAATSLNNFADLAAEDDDVGARILTHALFDGEGGWSGQAAALFEAQSNGPEWLSFGVRPVYAFTPWLSLAFEPGVDVNFGDGEGLRALGKATLALELKHGTMFFDRPVLRLFVTHAQFDETARRLGIAPELASGRGNNATTFGIQIEHFY